MDTITCECGATYAPKDKNAVTKHEATAKHQKGVTMAAETKAFDEVLAEEIDADGGWDLDDEAIVWPETFDALDEMDAAKSFTSDERLSIVNSIAPTKSAYDESVTPKAVAESYVAAVLDATPNVNDKVLPDLQTYAEGVVRVLRAEGVAPLDEPEEVVAKREVVKATNADIKAKAAKPKPAPKAKATRAPAAVATNGKKKCRVCGKIKPLEEYRVKSSRPDGRDTICADCAKAWLVAHKAKAGAK